MATRRLTRANTLAGSTVELEARYVEFERDFRVFFPAAQAYAKDVRSQQRTSLAADAG
jgi:acyl carrier protein phosphodiesterase